MKRRCGGRNVNWRGAVDVASLALSRSQPPRRAAPRCFASRHDACVTSLRPKPCVDSHAFRDEGRFRLHTHGLGKAMKTVPLSFRSCAVRLDTHRSVFEIILIRVHSKSQTFENAEWYSTVPLWRLADPGSSSISINAG